MVVEPIEEGETLVNLLLKGNLDGVLAPKTPQAYLNGDTRLERLFPDVEVVEQAYYRKTGFFPIMHLVGLRKTLAIAHPWLPKALYDGFVAARDIAIRRMRDIWMGNANRLSLPWLGASLERTIKTMGPDYWRYGFTANRHELDTMCRCAHEQHLANARLVPETLFDPSLLET